MPAHKSLIWAIGPIGICADDRHTIISEGRWSYHQVLGNLMVGRRRTRNSLRMARATEEDFRNFEKLLNEGQQLIDQYEDEDDPEKVIDKISALMGAALWSQGRILFGFEVALDNAFDETLDYLDFKPHIKQGIWLRNKLAWLIWLMQLFRIEPWK